MGKLIQATIAGAGLGFALACGAPDRPTTLDQPRQESATVIVETVDPTPTIRTGCSFGGSGADTYSSAGRTVKEPGGFGAVALPTGAHPVSGCGGPWANAFPAGAHPVSGCGGNGARDGIRSSGRDLGVYSGYR